MTQHRDKHKNNTAIAREDSNVWAELVTNCCRNVRYNFHSPQFNPVMTESLQRVYDAFKSRFANPGAEKIYRGVAVAQWVAVQLKNPDTASVVADNIIAKVKNLGEGVYTSLITAKSNAKKHITKDQVIKTELDKMMK